ncbi:MAG: metallophosphoesterase [Deltaproteobacteria bacterium]|nr:metallophosphoesterase [Deltaproteobacteria bacterium]
MSAMNFWRFIAFFTVAMTIWTGLYVYAGHRLISPSGLSPSYRLLAWLVLAAVTFAGPLVLFSGRITTKPGWFPAAAMIGFGAMGFMAIVVPLLFTKDIGLLLVAAVSKVHALVAGRAAAGLDAGRRLFLVNALNLGVLGAAAALVGIGYAAARRRPLQVVRVDIPIADLPPAFDGFKIAQLSDIHLGASVIRREHMESIVEAANALSPDIVAFTGDLADGYARELRADAAPLSSLRAPDGKFFVTGNHEYYWDLHGWLSEVRRLGFDVLTNEHRLVRRGDAVLAVAGVPDISAASMVPEHVPEPETALRGAPEGARRILLAHQPRSFRAAEAAGVDLQLSGHTHGGQFWPWTFVIRLVMPFVVGLHRFQKMWLYVNPGTGTWGPPLRLGMPSQITLLTLRRGS